MKITDERERWENKDRKKKRGDSSVSVTAKWFCCGFKLGFLQLISKASVIFKSILEWALLIILKERELYETKHVEVECRCWLVYETCHPFQYVPQS